MLMFESLHHASVPVSDLRRSRQFYGGILGLVEIPRPPFDFPGAWYDLGWGRQLHLIQDDRPQRSPTFRENKGVDSRDIHFAVRVRDYREALEYLQSQGYREDAEDDLKKIRNSPAGAAGFPQIYILDPDRNVIEINAASGH